MTRKVFVDLGNGRQRLVGEIVMQTSGDRVFKVFRKEREHFFKIWNGFGLNEKVLTGLIESGVKSILIELEKEDKTRVVFKVSPSVWLNKGFEWVWSGKNGNKRIDFFERQRILNLNFFDKI